MRVVIINGAYRVHGLTDLLLQEMRLELTRRQIPYDYFVLRDLDIRYCYNCRGCMQSEQGSVGHCHQQDDMQTIIAAIERSDAFILASPTNMGTVTAVYKCFMERLSVYGFWPFGQSAPKYRHAGVLQKRAILLHSSAAPAWMAYWAFNTHKVLAKSAYLLGAKVVGRFSIGLQSKPLPITLSQAHIAQAQRWVERLLSTR